MSSEVILRGDVRRKDGRRCLKDKGPDDKQVCVFCLANLSLEDVERRNLTSLDPFNWKELKLTLDSKSKNEQAFAFLCKLLNINEVGRWEGAGFFGESKGLSLCLKCEHMYQEIFQLGQQIRELQVLIDKRVELIRVAVRRSGDGGSDKLKAFRHQIVLDVRREGEEIKAAHQNDAGLNVRRKRACTRKVENDQPEPGRTIKVEEAQDGLGEHEDNWDDPLVVSDDNDDDVDGKDPLYIPDCQVTIHSEGKSSPDPGSGGDLSSGSEENGDDDFNPSGSGGPNARNSKRDRIKPAASSETEKKMTFVCHICDEKVTGYGPFIQHYETVHPDEKRYTCKFCNKYFRKLSGVTIHQRTHTGEKLFSCDYCDKRFTTRKSRVAHLKYIHLNVEKLHACEECGKRFPTENGLRYHREIHTTAVIVCKICRSCYKSNSAFIKHNRQKHDGKAECTEPMEQEEILSRGVEVVGLRQPVVCHLCWTSLSGLVTIDQHFAKVHPNCDPKQCKCGKTFSTYRDCRRHAVRHVGEKHFQCESCPMRFFTKLELNNHSRVHIPNRSQAYVCDTCGAKFMNKGSLTMHRQKHTSSRWVCELCGKSYAERKGYMLHKKSAHLNIKPHVCPHCPRSYTQLSELSKHLRTHTNEKPYECSFCEKRFPYASSRARHVMEVHKKDKSKRKPKAVRSYALNSVAIDVFSGVTEDSSSTAAMRSTSAFV